MITQEQLKLVLHYDPLTGLWTRLISPWKGKRVVSKSTRYPETMLFGKRYRLHRLAFLYMTGKIPDQVDHIDRDKHNCTWSNLREADNHTNQSNTSVRVTNKQGIKGLCWCSTHSTWKGQKMLYGKIKSKTSKNKQIVLDWLVANQT